MMKRIFLPLITALLSAGLCFGQNTDISLVYASYLGGSSEEFFEHRTLTHDSQGRAAFVGSTASNFMQTSSDAYQSELLGGANNFNSFIVRVDENGIPFYTSYFGGGGERTAALAFTDDGKILLGGRTEQSNLPATDGAHQTEFLQNPESGQISRMGFIAQFTTSNELEWCTYLGGNRLDNVSHVVSGTDNAVYAVGSTNSTGLGTEGSLQETLPEGVMNAGFLARFTSAGDLDYYTYLGDTASTGAFRCVLSSDGTKLYIAGGTSAPQGFISEGVQGEYSGSSDVFLTCFEAASGDLLWSRYIGGPEIDVIDEMDITESGEIVLSLTTLSDGLATPGAHLEIPPAGTGAAADGANRLIAVLDDNGQTIWATYFDKIPVSFRDAALSVQGDNILISGKTTSEEGVTHGMPIEPDFPESSAYVLAKFDLETGAQLWGTYFGNEAASFAEIADIIHLDDGRFFTFGRTAHSNGYITEDADQPTYFGNIDFFCAIFEENSLSVRESNKVALEVYPNPAASEVRITLPESLFGSARLRLYDINGREVSSISAFRSGETVPVHSLPDGMYIIRLTNGGADYRAKLVVAR